MTVEVSDDEVADLLRLFDLDEVAGAANQHRAAPRGSAWMTSECIAWSSAPSLSP